MTSKYQFGIRFVNGEALFLLGERKAAEWTVLHRVDLESSAMASEMVRFCQRVKKESNGESAVAIFLPEPDVQITEVPTPKKKKKKRLLHVQRTLARRLLADVDSLEVVCGPIDKYNVAPVLYALKETLQSARHFVSRFGFEVAYFGSFEKHTAFAKQPRLQVAKRARPSVTPYIGAAVQPAYYIAFTAIFSTIALLLGSGANNDATNFATLYSEPPTYAALQFDIAQTDQEYRPVVQSKSLGNVASTKAQGYDLIASIDKPTMAEYARPNLPTVSRNQDTYAQRLQEPAPRNVSSVLAVALSAPAELHTPQIAQVSDGDTQIASLPLIDADVVRKETIQVASRVLPSQQHAQLMDQVPLIKGGFFVFIGQQKNLTKALPTRDYRDAKGQVVFITDRATAPVQHGISMPLYNMDRADLSWPEGQDIKLVSAYWSE